MIEYEWDEAKRQSNALKHGVGFVAIEEFEWETALVEPVERHGERRYTAAGYVGARVHVVVFTERLERIRVISLRRANQREVRRYAEARAGPPRPHARGRRGN